MTSHLRPESFASRSRMVFGLRERSLPDRIWLKEDRLYYDWDFDQKKKAARRANVEEALAAFIKIKGDADVLRFARRFGPLGICEHDKPCTHNPAGPDIEVSDRATGCSPRGWHDLPAWDPVDVWLSYVHRARELLRVAARLHLDQLRDEDFEVLVGRPRDLQSEREWERVFQQRVTPTRRLRDARLLLGMTIDEWMRFGDVRPQFWWGGETPDIGLAGSTFGMIAVQLAAEVAQAPSFSQCDACQKPYFRRGRKPQSGRRNYCPDCGTTAANRLGQREFRKRKRGEQ